MAMSKPSCCSSSSSSSLTEEQAKVEVEPEPQPSTSAAAAAALGQSQENKLSGVEHEKELIRIRAEMICIGCRCGWLCCDCIMGCLSCKQRRRFCYCRWVPAALTGRLVRIPCLICLDLLESCTCQLAWRCKWCTVSMEKCKRGGCVTLLPDRSSQEGAIYVEIFNRDDKSDDEEELDTCLGRTMDKLSLAESSSNFSWDGSNSSRGSSWSVESSASQQGGAAWWQNQNRGSSTTAAAVASSTDETGSVSNASSSDDSRYASSDTLSSMSSGGSYSSVGGKSDF